MRSGRSTCAERRVVLDGALVGEPQQRATVVAQRVGHLALRRLGPQLHRAHPRRRVLRDVLLHERFLAAVDPDHRQRPVLELGKDPVAHARRGSRPGPASSRPRRRTAAGRGWSAAPRPARHSSLLPLIDRDASEQSGVDVQGPGRRRSDRGVITCPVTTPGPMYIGTKRRLVNFQSPPSFAMSSK